MMIAMAHPSRPNMVLLMKAGAKRAHDFRSAEKSNNGMAMGMATEATVVYTACISSVSGIKPVSPKVQPMM